MRFVSLPRLLALLAVLFATHSMAAERLNVLFLFADDQRPDTIAALGNPAIHTPNLDRLVKTGVAFQRAYMQGGLQGATCVPSRAMLLSGKSLFRVDEKLMRDETWPAAFGKSGYTTFMSGKWHNGANSIAKSFQIARSVFSGGMTDPMKAKLADVTDGKLGKPETAPKHACEVFADEAIRFLREHKGGPFLCYVPFDAPHDPHVVPADFPIQYDPAKIPLPANFLPQHPFDNGEMVIRDEVLLPWPRKEDDVRKMNAEYYRYISYLDAQIGRVLDALEASPFAKNTIVVFAADSGVARGSHGLIGKQNVYEHSMRVPLIIRGPGIPADKVSEAMCYLFDVMPTLGALCGVKAPAASEGIDFQGALRDPSQAARKEIVLGYRGVQRALRDDRWKLIRYPHIDRTQLFDLQADPDEKTDLAAKPEHAARIAAMMAQLEKEAAAFGDKAPLKVANPRPAEWLPPVRRAAGAQEPAVPRVFREVEGWKVGIAQALIDDQPAATERALELLKAQLAEVVRVVPKAAVEELRKVPLWFSAEYPDIPARAEYHPDSGWLRANRRDPGMAKGVEFTNIRVFEAETRRMPNFALHELAHAYHDRFLSFDEPRIIAAYEKAKAAGKYDKVERRDSEGRSRMDRAYAMTNHKEYFAETTEAFFSRNDFYPFNKEELKQHDPDMAALLEILWK